MDRAPRPPAAPKGTEMAPRPHVTVNVEASSQSSMAGSQPASATSVRFQNFKADVQSGEMYRGRFSRGVSPTAPSYRPLKRPQRPPGKPSTRHKEAHRVTSDPILDDPVFQIWLRENPGSSDVEKAAEMYRRQCDRVEAEKVYRLRLLREAQNELAELSRQEEISRKISEVEEEQRTWMRYQQQMAIVEQSKLSDMSPSTKALQTSDDHLKQQQKDAWLKFCGSLGNPFEAGLHAHDTFESSSEEEDTPIEESEEAATPMNFTATVDSVAEETVKEPEFVHTHEHEIAANTVQCAFRCFYAKKRVNILRVARQAAVQYVVQSEEQAEHSWKAALMVGQVAAATLSAMQATMWAAKRWRMTVKASILRRKMQQERELSGQYELSNYAAVRIQSLFRGGRDRERTLLLRRPDIQRAREAERLRTAATRIQAVYLGYMTRKNLEEATASCCIIQRGYRTAVAKRRITALRKTARGGHSLELQNHAAACIQRFFQRLVARRFRWIHNFEPQFLQLQRVCRSYHARRHFSARTQMEAKGVRVLQRAVRMFLAKVERGHRAWAVAQLLQLEVDGEIVSATKMQSIYRMHKAKARYAQQKKLHSPETRNHAAGTITRSLRRNAAKKKTKRVQRERVDVAATKIAAMFRQWKAKTVFARRRNAAATQAEDVLKAERAAVIQALFRGFRTRKDIRSMAAAASTIQDAMKVTVSRSRVQRASTDVAAALDEGIQHDSARIIQQAYRATVARSRLNQYLNDKARVVTNAVRMAPDLKTVQKKRAGSAEKKRTIQANGAALLIQTISRGFLARNRVVHLISDRTTERDAVVQQEAHAVLRRFFRRHCANRKQAGPTQ